MSKKIYVYVVFCCIFFIRAYSHHKIFLLKFLVVTIFRHIFFNLLSEIYFYHNFYFKIFSEHFFVLSKNCHNFCFVCPKMLLTSLYLVTFSFRQLFSSQFVSRFFTIFSGLQWWLGAKIEQSCNQAQKGLAKSRSPGLVLFVYVK